MPTLYCGLRPPSNSTHLHCPLIDIVTRSNEELMMDGASEKGMKASCHLFTSQTAVELWFKFLNGTKRGIEQKIFLAIGKVTAESLRNHGVKKLIIAEEETLEGVWKSIQYHRLLSIFWPHSALSRPFLKDQCLQNNVSFEELILYTAKTKFPKENPNLLDFDEVIFTSPSIVKAFFEIFQTVPEHLKFKAIGPQTAQALANKRLA